MKNDNEILTGGVEILGEWQYDAIPEPIDADTHVATHILKRFN